MASNLWSSWCGFPKVRGCLHLPFSAGGNQLIFGWNDGNNFRGVTRHLVFFGSESRNPPCAHGQNTVETNQYLLWNWWPWTRSSWKNNTLCKWTTPTKQTKNTTIKQRKITFTYAFNFCIFFGVCAPTKNHLQPTFNRPSSAVVSLLGVPGRTHGRARPWGWEPGVKFWVQNSAKNGWFSGDFMMIYIDLVI